MYDDGQSYCTRSEHRPGTLPPVLETGRWYAVEVMLDGGTPTASVAGILLDEIVVSTERIGNVSVPAESRSFGSVKSLYR